MAWVTTKDGRKVNTDWFEEDEKKKYEQIEANKKEADRLNKKVKSFEDAEDNNPAEWFYDHSNLGKWQLDYVSDEEKKAIKDFIGDDGKYINGDLYNSRNNSKADKIEAALNRFELRNSIEVVRDTDFQIFGNKEMSIEQIKQFLNSNGPRVNVPGFMSFSADEVGHQTSKGANLRIKLTVPPNTGAGAYIARFSRLPSEREFLLNKDSKLEFDVNSLHQDNNKIVINAYWKGRGDK